MFGVVNAMNFGSYRLVQSGTEHSHKQSGTEHLHKQSGTEHLHKVEQNIYTNKAGDNNNRIINTLDDVKLICKSSVYTCSTTDN